MRSEDEIREKIRWCRASQEMTSRSLESAAARNEPTIEIARLAATFGAERAMVGILEWVLT
jgi:hypothetical protein